VVEVIAVACIHSVVFMVLGSSRVAVMRVDLVVVCMVVRFVMCMVVRRSCVLSLSYTSC